MKRLAYLSKKSSRVFNSYEKAYRDAKMHRMCIFNETELIAENKAFRDIETIFLYLDI